MQYLKEGSQEKGAKDGARSERRNREMPWARDATTNETRDGTRVGEFVFGKERPLMDELFYHNCIKLLF